MIVGVLSVEVSLFEARTLKEKRRTIKSLKDRIRNRFNVSIAEVAFNDQPKRARIGITIVANESRYVHEVLDKIIDVFQRTAQLSLIDYERELL